MAPDAQIDVTTWQVEGKTPEEVEAAAKKVRAAHPDLVIVAVPFFETFKSDELFSSWYNQILGNSFSGGHQEWDVVAIQPSLKRPAKTEAESRQDELAQRLILAHDLSLPTISPASEGKPLSETFSEWLVEQVAPKLKELP